MRLRYVRLRETARDAVPCDATLYIAGAVNVAVAALLSAVQHA